LEKAGKDLDIFYRLTENGISIYHQQKMEEVNKIIHQIWKSVYHGNDINDIAIHAAQEVDSKKKKNFHYSIIMEKEIGGNVRM
jgi:DNA repair protein RAD50